VVKFRQIISTHAGRIGRSIRPTIRGNSLRALIRPISCRNQDMPPVSQDRFYTRRGGRAQRTHGRPSN
jgi:hypothetical protein